MRFNQKRMAAARKERRELDTWLRRGMIERDTICLLRNRLWWKVGHIGRRGFVIVDHGPFATMRAAMAAAATGTK